MNAENSPAVGAPVEPTVRHHEWDDDGCCLHCGFDGAEWWHWKHNTYEGKAQPHVKQPLCRDREFSPAELVRINEGWRHAPLLRDYQDRGQLYDDPGSDVHDHQGRP